MAQAVREGGAADQYRQRVTDRKVGQTQSTGWMFLGEEDVAFGAMLGAPLAHASLQGAQQAGGVLAWMAALELFEQRDSVEQHVGVQQRYDFSFPDAAQRVLAGASASLRALRRQAVGALDAPGAAFADAGARSGGHLGMGIAVVLVLVHLVVRDLLAEHAAPLRSAVEGFTVAPPPGPARFRPSNRPS